MTRPRPVARSGWCHIRAEAWSHERCWKPGCPCPCHEAAEATAPPAYDRAVLVEVLVYHYRRDISSCGCGWAELGRSHPEHVATVYEMSVESRS